jgi:inner membrane protein
LDKRTPLATLTLVVAANAPDVDVLSYARGEFFALAFRRGITHGLPAQATLPFLVAGAVVAWDRFVRRRRFPDAPPVSPGQILFLAFVGVLTHPVLDWMNVYGMRWALPFDGAWTYGDALFIIDPWLWLMLGGGVFLSGAGSRIAWGILAVVATLLMAVGPVPPLASFVWVAGVLSVLLLARGDASRGAATRPRWARRALVLVSAYIVAMVAGTKLAARQVTAHATASGLAPMEVLLSPNAADPFSAEVEVVTPDGYVPGVFSWTGRPRVALRRADMVPFVTLPDNLDQAAANLLMDAAERDPNVRAYLVWSRFPYRVVSRDGADWAVRYSDARYDGREGAGGLGGLTVRVPSAP